MAATLRRIAVRDCANRELSVCKTADQCVERAPVSLQQSCRLPSEILSLLEFIDTVRYRSAVHRGLRGGTVKAESRNLRLLVP